MALFGNKQQNYLGIDIGGSSIKLVELKDVNGRPQLVTYGFVEFETNILKSNAPENREAIIKALRHIMKEAQVTSDKALTGLPSFTVFSSIISLPTMSKKELMSAVKWEAKKFVPMPVEEMILDWEIIKDHEATEEKDEKKKEKDEKGGAKPSQKDMKVLLTAAPRNLVERYVDIFKGADLELVSLETQAFALERSLIGRDKAPIMVVDIGATATDIMVFIDGIPLVTRSLDIGGNNITQTIARSMNVADDRAEQFKRDFGLSSVNNSASRVPKTIEFVISNIVNEIKYVLNLYQNQGNSKPIEKIILCGGSSFLVNLTDYLQNIFSTKVFIGDPWARVMYPVELKPIWEEIGPRFAVAVGFAMRQIVS
ncbi:MAG: hypothetical protein COT25_02280 [Candidatus Kerfeldbacteria bacterium CG08_land_8_20_14_0_20_42_7]|uniref:SHS2 domain-containing protein n=1 Tax=Candidatus Kerfeldbacteria bacterium CG08_land_8_20_14_0_20_42_7 TaxID=2014245 RepID=A0A2H0YSW5_9BACT|nr:MAG: hypothetical protein COT25_02280 [Candidatus Kerfeldbacteria bacterium CG08_land_8_20_14_0_20_42_7]